MLFHTLTRRADYNAAALTPHTTNLSRLRTTRAFTLIELIVVVIIIGVLASIVSVSYNQFVGQARDAAVLASAFELATAVNVSATQQGLAPDGVDVPGLGVALGSDYTTEVTADQVVVRSGSSCATISLPSVLTETAFATLGCDAAAPADPVAARDWPPADNSPIAIDGTNGGTVVATATGFTLTIPNLGPNRLYHFAGLNESTWAWWSDDSAAQPDGDLTDGAGTLTVTLGFLSPELVAEYGMPSGLPTAGMLIQIQGAPDNGLWPFVNGSFTTR